VQTLLLMRLLLLLLLLHLAKSLLLACPSQIRPSKPPSASLFHHIFELSFLLALLQRNRKQGPCSVPVGKK
jgi:hypothetical protein